MATLLLALLIVQPQGEIIWSRPDSCGVYTAIPQADIDGDGLPDVVAAIYYGAYPAPRIQLYCHSGRTGAEIWQQGDCKGTWGNKGLATVADVDGDSVRDVLLGSPGGAAPGSSAILKSGADGMTRWQWCTYEQGPNWGWVYSVREFTDLTGDARPEVLAGVGGNSNDRSGTVMCFNGATGDTVWTYRVPSDGCQCLALTDDVTGDAVPEIAVGAGGNGLDNHVYLVNGRTGAQLWSYDMGNSVWSVARSRDLDHDGVADVVAGSWDHNVAALDGATGQCIWDVTPSSYIVTEVVPIRDINGDTLDDVIVGTWASSVYVLSGHDGSTIWSEPVGADCWPVDTLADVTGDGLPEVVVGALNGRLVKVFNGVTHEALWQYSFAERIYDVTGAPDLDGDGVADVLVSLQDQENEADHLFAFKGMPGTATPEPHLTRAPWSLNLQGRVLTVSGPQGERFELLLVTGAGRVLHRLGSGRMAGAPVSLRLDAELPVGTSFLLLKSACGTCAVKAVNLR